MEKKVRDSVNAFYAAAAHEPVKSLCCATGYSPQETAHIPADVLEVSYGCGSPVSLARIEEGSTVLDLGSGGGIDCFLAAKKVGPGGKVIGVDMTDEMLDIASRAAPRVAENLGFGVVEFKKGFLEEIPVEDGSVDVVTSNCVINLSADKARVLKEIHRVLKPAGRFCISDVVSESEVPEEMRKDRKLWGECLSGAMSEEAFLRAAREAGFYGLRTVSRSVYNETQGLRFHSIVLNGYRCTEDGERALKGHRAVYNGPFSSVRDDSGREYPAGVPVEVCAVTAERLSREPYCGAFSISGPAAEPAEPAPQKCC